MPPDNHRENMYQKNKIGTFKYGHRIPKHYVSSFRVHTNEAVQHKYRCTNDELNQREEHEGGHLR